MKSLLIIGMKFSMLSDFHRAVSEEAAPQYEAHEGGSNYTRHAETNGLRGTVYFLLDAVAGSAWNTCGRPAIS